MKKLLFLTPLVLFTSCATVMLKKDYCVTVSSNLKNAKAEIQDSIYHLPIDIKLKRSKEDLNINLISGSFEKMYIIKSSPNAAFLYGNLIFYPISPLVYGIDFTNQKRFYYGKSIDLNYLDTAKVIIPKIAKGYVDYWRKNFQTNKGQTNFTFSLPWVNHFYFHPIDEPIKVNTGFLGLSAGLEYFYRDYKYISLKTSAVMDFFIPFPAHVDYSGEFENMYSVFVSVSDNFRLRRFSIGYGLNYSRNIWKLMYHNRFDPPPPTRDPVTKYRNAIGVTIDAYHQINQRLHFGLIYRPTLLNLHTDVDLIYEHLISLELKWGFKILKSKEPDSEYRSRFF